MYVWIFQSQKYILIVIDYGPGCDGGSTCYWIERLGWSKNSGILFTNEILREF